MLVPLGPPQSKRGGARRRPCDEAKTEAVERAAASAAQKRAGRASHSGQERRGEWAAHVLAVGALVAVGHVVRVQSHEMDCPPAPAPPQRFISRLSALQQGLLFRIRGDATQGPVASERRSVRYKVASVRTTSNMPQFHLRRTPLPQAPHSRRGQNKASEMGENCRRGGRHGAFSTRTPDPVIAILLSDRCSAKRAPVGVVVADDRPDGDVWKNVSVGREELLLIL